MHSVVAYSIRLVLVCTSSCESVTAVYLLIYRANVSIEYLADSISLITATPPARPERQCVIGTQRGRTHGRSTLDLPASFQTPGNQTRIFIRRTRKRFTKIKRSK